MVRAEKAELSALGLVLRTFKSSNNSDDTYTAGKNIMLHNKIHISWYRLTIHTFRESIFNRHVARAGPVVGGR